MNLYGSNQNGFYFYCQECNSVIPTSKRNESNEPLDQALYDV